MNRTFEIRLYTNKEQQRLLDSTFGACRFVYNNVLSIRQSYFKDYKFKSTDLNIEQMLKAFNPWLNNVEAKALQQSIRDLDKAYSNWFNSLSKKTKQKYKSPKFKKKFGSFCNMISYKSLMYKRNYIKIDTFFPSSKLCHCCGFKYNGLSLDERYWICPECGTYLDRDVNAALNVLKEGQRILNSG